MSGQSTTWASKSHSCRRRHLAADIPHQCTLAVSANFLFVHRVSAWAEPDMDEPAIELLVAPDAGSAAPTEVVAGTAFPVMDAQDAECAADNLAAGLDAALQVHFAFCAIWRPATDFMPCEGATMPALQVS